MSGRRKEPQGGRRGGLAAALLLLFAGQLAVGGFHLAALGREYAAGEAAYHQLSQSVQPAPAPSPGGAERPEKTPVPWPQVDFDALAAINPDVVGWISIDGTGIDYPIVQGEDNRAYLSRLFTGEGNRAGCLFLDCGNSADFSDRNSVVYGHELRDGTMFSPLLGYKEQDYFDAHPTGWLVTAEGGYLIRFFSGFVSGTEGDAWDLSPARGWAEEMAGRSLFAGGPAPREGDRVLTLSTCSYEFSDARFVLLGILEEPTADG